jgi:pyruvate dehydrogenase E1 component beta subunit
MSSNESPAAISQARAIRDALSLAMEQDDNVFLTGEGVTDPRGIFGTTLDLVERFGRERIFDAPLSENCVAGVCVGAAMTGLKPVLVFSRIEFALLAMDQLINNAARFAAIYAKTKSFPIVVRVIFGSASQKDKDHARDLQSLFAHIPDLSAVMPTDGFDAKGLLLSAIRAPYPVLFMEHRCLHGTTGDVPPGVYSIPLNKAEISLPGEHVTVAAFSYSVLSAISAAHVLQDFGVRLEVINMRCLTPVDTITLSESIKKTGRLIVADTNNSNHGIGSLVISHAIENSFYFLTKPPAMIDACDSIIESEGISKITAEAISIAKSAMSLLEKSWEGSNSGAVIKAIKEQEDR